MLTAQEVQDPKRFPPQSFEARMAPKNQEQRKDPMCRIRITSLVDGQVIPGAYVIPAGVHTAVVHERDLPAIEAMVEPNPELIEVARLAFDRKVKASVADELARCVDQDPEGIEVKAVMQKAYEQFPGSVAGTFHQFNDRDILPFAKVEVLERGITAPAAQAIDDIQKTTAKLVADQVANNGADTASIISQAISQTLEQLSKSGMLRGSNDIQKR